VGEEGAEVVNHAVRPEQTVLNAICPYFTMFPLDFPMSVLGRSARSNQVVLDPFCGRGTTNFAARLLGLPTFGIDASPVAVAATAAKLVKQAAPEKIVSEAREILSSYENFSVPTGQFWSRAYRPAVLKQLCKLRAALLENCRSEARKALRGLLLGALHGPLHADGTSSYLSNQAPRTYAPKPRYAVSFWNRTGYRAPNVNVLSIIQTRAARFYGQHLPHVESRVICGDSRSLADLRSACGGRRAKIIVTSPPYYGMRTYLPDQWLRNWFLGGEDKVDYSYGTQLSHRGTLQFVDDLRRVWLNVAAVSQKEAKLIFRFGAINDRSVNPTNIIKASLKETPWRLTTILDAGTSRQGKRQADSFVREARKPLVEFDAWAILGA
jgi:hypothetical protein